MASNYQQITWFYETIAGAPVQVGAGVQVKVYSVALAANIAESPLTTDADGKTAAGTAAAVAVGDELRFRVENYLGLAFSVSQITT